jgi:UDPglucose 6-dehydrogenase
MASRLCVVGLGKLGAPIAACFAARGFHVIGVDADVQKVQAVAERRPPVVEPGLVEMLAAAGARLEATKDLESAVAASDATFIVVPTPSEPDGGFSLTYVLAACEEIGRAIGRVERYHLVVLTSTVMPGSTGGPVAAVLERASGKRCGTDFGLCYGPEFIALGSVIRDFLNPDFVLVGESDPRAGETLAAIYRRTCERPAPVARMNFVNAELTKLSVNTFVTTKISFANMLARICERLPGGDVDVVTRALGLDTRVGGKYFRGAISYGGPCFPRDNAALSALSRRLGAPADLAETTDRFNREQIEWLAEYVQRAVPAGGSAGILGLTYKADTDVVDEAPGLLLARALGTRGVAVCVFDPVGQRNAMTAMGHAVRFAPTAEDCVTRSDVVVVATAWPEFGTLATGIWSRPDSPRTVIDCWRWLGHLANVDGVRYVGLGVGA